MTEQVYQNFDIIWLAILNREEPKKTLLKVIAWDPSKETSNLTFSTLWSKYDFLIGLVFTPVVLILCQEVWEPSAGSREFWYSAASYVLLIIYIFFLSRKVV